MNIESAGLNVMRVGGADQRVCQMVTADVRMEPSQPSSQTKTGIVRSLYMGCFRMMIILCGTDDDVYVYGKGRNSNVFLRNSPQVIYHMNT